MFSIRPTKGRGGMGGYGGKPQKKPMKQVSKKGRKRQGELKSKLEVVLSVQEQVLGARFCLARLGHPAWKFRCPSLDGREYPLNLDHVNTRNQEDADRYENLQALCSWCNFQKGSVRGLDFRPRELVAKLRELDEKENNKRSEYVQEDI